MKNKLIYQAPSIELSEYAVEEGIAQSFPQPTNPTTQEMIYEAWTEE